MPTVERLGLALILGYGSVLAYMLVFEDNYIYFPDRQITQTPEDMGLRFSEHEFHATDGTTLHGWYMPRDNARFTVLHFHGNAGNISQRLPLYRRWHNLGLSVFTFDYRGYGHSEGKPSEAGLYEDARAAWSELTGQIKIPPDSVILAGRSLGCAVAAQLSAEVQAGGLALETPFTNISDMAAYYYPWLPLRWLAHSRFDTLGTIKHNKNPLLIVGAKEDGIVPAGMDEQIFSAAGGRKIHHIFPGGHNDFDVIAGSAYKHAWQAWLSGLGSYAGQK